MSKPITPKTSRPASSLEQLFDDAFAFPDRATSLSVFVQASRSSPESKAKLAERGVARKWLTTIATLLDLPVGTVRRWLGLQAHHCGHRLGSDDGAGVLAQASLIGRVQSIVVESGDPANFDAGWWTASFLTRTNMALGLRRPFEYMGTIEGRAIVSRLINAQQNGPCA